MEMIKRQRWIRSKQRNETLRRYLEQTSLSRIFTSNFVNSLKQTRSSEYWHASRGPCCFSETRSTRVQRRAAVETCSNDAAESQTRNQKEDAGERRIGKTHEGQRPGWSFQGGQNENDAERSEVACPEKKGNKVAFRKLWLTGSRHLESGRIKDARRTFRDALKLQPNHPKAYANLGWCAMNEKAYGKAIVQFKAALAKRPRFADGLFGLGYAYEKEGSSASAIRVYKRYLRYYPKGKKSAMVKTRLKQLQPR